MKTYKIHLIRHGMTEANTAGQYIGQRTDLPLSAQGLLELRELTEETEYPKISRLYTSPMLRCRQTAAVIYGDMPVFPVDKLIEYDFGEFEGKTAAELEGNVNFMRWTSGAIAAPPSGESNTDFIKRLCVGLKQIVLDMMDNNIYEAGVIMHGGAMMMLLGATAVPQRKSIEWVSEPGRGYSIMITPSLYHSNGIVEVYDLVP